MKFISNLSNEHIAQYCESSLSSWGNGWTLEVYTQRNLGHMARSNGLLHFCGVLNDQGELLASLKRYQLTISTPKKQNIPAIGIGAVFTREIARRQGAASELLQRVLEEAKQEGIEAALLFSDIKPDFYERLGFVAYEAVDRSLSVEGIPQSNALTREFTASDEDFCYQSRIQSWDASAARCAPTLAEWRFFRWRNAKNPCIILQQGGRDIGYVIVEAEERCLWIEEWAAPGIPEDVVLSVLFDIARHHGKSEIKGWLPPSKMTSYQEEPRSQAIPMLYCFDRSIQPERALFWSVEHF
jgi:GNAT superfamily N-acetyltransferase